MLLWIALAAMTGLAALALLWPLAQRGSAATPQASDVAIYKDQLAEIDRDLERGLIARSEAQAARIEVSRRLIEADEGEKAEKGRQPAGQASIGRRRLAAAIVLVAVPLLSLGLYAYLGSPSSPDQPLAARLDGNIENASLDELVARVEAKLAENPEDGRGWDLMAQIYLRQQRFEDAKQAYANALRLLGSTAEREANFGVAIVAAADRMVTADAKAAFQRALKLDPKEFRSAYFLGLAKEQDGDKKGAVEAWQALIPDNPNAADFLRQEIARVGGQPQAAPDMAARGPSQDDVKAAQAMTPEERGKMIQGMVSGLSERLKSQGGSPEEWMKLIKAYSVLGQADNARTALADARKALANSPDAIRQMDELSKALGL
ncbi:c-type cytochrome biogenesis protein CcmI [Labrys sp. LIt4]|uniref:C-type cytochrome biogenesis protein CcmI n=1 Tax=Labrys okinawensis TaxID=346911 RepID=A0A2S9QFG1_9HYPH|nr:MULTISPECIES: c-type cytochrome biogenesis protein CcmI [Labrys]MBP0578284.1 c-type cytochrome biogenesis protein CcmI [Labrys sp. LIt4]PRH88084.1 c-type cytochrome biogenesis protein CcmI [Labrys okinawensis]